MHILSPQQLPMPCFCRSAAAPAAPGFISNSGNSRGCSIRYINLESYMAFLYDSLNRTDRTHLPTFQARHRSSETEYPSFTYYESAQSESPSHILHKTFPELIHIVPYVYASIIPYPSSSAPTPLPEPLPRLRTRSASFQVS
jgi:hypothetical protein